MKFDILQLHRLALSASGALKQHLQPTITVSVTFTRSAVSSTVLLTIAVTLQNIGLT